MACTHVFLVLLYDTSPFRDSLDEIPEKINTVGCVGVSRSSSDTHLTDIHNKLKDRNILDRQPDGVWLLNAGIVTQRGSTLTIDSKDTKWLKVYILAQEGFRKSRDISQDRTLSNISECSSAGKAGSGYPNQGGRIRAIESINERS